ncbi:DUF1330 domain-containing protein [Oceanibium sediminis]|uniref:DUF1330 domain-containing protein n=1 Tax=Oceanibium sediminis TaxID=2026339 RepID=UPI000DD39749|nr:DUF1330 domain-containing protein [Oceanibium sediminis]
MPALWIAHVEVTDPDAYAKYAEVASGSIPAHGGVFIARGGRAEQMEGRAFPRNVVARFPTMEAALACYNSPEYQSVVDIAKGASERSLVILETDS